MDQNGEKTVLTTVDITEGVSLRLIASVYRRPTHVDADAAGKSLTSRIERWHFLAAFLGKELSSSPPKSFLYRDAPHTLYDAWHCHPYRCRGARRRHTLARRHGGP